MPSPYEERLKAIRKILADPSEEVAQEGYGLLFKLWLENVDNSDFIQDLIPIALEHQNAMQELESRLGELSVRDTITDTFLKKQLRVLMLEVSKLKVEKPKDGATAKETLRVDVIAPEKQKTRFVWWQIALVDIILIALWVIVFKPHIYQEIIVLVIATISVITLPYLLPRKDRIIAADLLATKLNYTFPTYLSLGDVNTVHFFIENLGRTKFIGEITLVFKDPESFVTPAPNQNLTASVEVPPQGREAKQFNFLVLKKPADGSLDYCFQITSGESQFISKDENFQIAPIPYLRSAWAWLFGSAGLGALIVALLWDQVKKMIGIP